MIRDATLAGRYAENWRCRQAVSQAYAGPMMVAPEVEE
jgi:hypothetical protein